MFFLPSKKINDTKSRIGIGNEIISIMVFKCSSIYSINILRGIIRLICSDTDYVIMTGNDYIISTVSLTIIPNVMNNNINNMIDSLILNLMLFAIVIVSNYVFRELGV